jgi:hypothetical protein
MTADMMLESHLRAMVGEGQATSASLIQTRTAGAGLFPRPARSGSATAVFADFNETRGEPEPAPIEEEPSQDEAIVNIREEAWTDGYLIGRQKPTGDRADQALTAKLLTTLHELETNAAEAVDAASLTIADLLVNTVIAVASDDWPGMLLGRVRRLAERIKPALTVTPEFLLRDNYGTERSFADISELSRALEDGMGGEGVTIRWQRGEATINRTALLEDLREAVVPLSAGLVNAQNARQQS